MKVQVSVLLVLVACTKASEPSRSESKTPGVRVAGDAGLPPRITDDATTTSTEEDPCPKQGGPQTTAVQRIGLYGRIYPHEQGRIWHSTKHFKVIGRDNKDIENVDVKTVPRGFIALSTDAWFVQSCENGKCGPHGTGRIISRIERGAPTTTKLAGPQSEIAFAEIISDSLYWATFGPYGNSGELKRVPTKGGKTETLWTGRGVTTVLIDNGVAFVSDGATVSSVPLDGRKPLVLAKDLTEARGLAVEDKHLYIADRGDPHMQSKDSGSILRVPRAGGAVEKLAGPIRWPSVVGVDSDRIYYMSDRSGDVWVIPKKGGKPQVLIPTPPNDWPCRVTRWLQVNDRGLLYLRMSEGWDTSTGKVIDWGTLWAIQRQWMQDPVKQFADYVAKHGRGSSAGSAVSP